MAATLKAGGNIMRAWWLVPALMMMAGAADAATPTTDCAANMVCASRPQSVVDALQAAGYKAALTKSKSTGNPMIESAASGYNFTIYFYGCEEMKDCNSLQFGINFADDGGNTIELANKWNQSKRFIQMSLADDKPMACAIRCKRCSFCIEGAEALNVTTAGKNMAFNVPWCKPGLTPPRL